MANASHNHLHSLTHVVFDGNIQYEVYVTYVDGKGKPVPLLEEKCSFAAKDELQTYVKALIESHVKADSRDLKSLQELVITKDALYYSNNPSDKVAHANCSLQTSVKSDFLKTCTTVQSVWDKTARLLLSDDYEVHSGDQLEAEVEAPKTIPPEVAVTLEPAVSSSTSSSQGNSSSSATQGAPAPQRDPQNTIDGELKKITDKYNKPCSTEDFPKLFNELEKLYNDFCQQTKQEEAREVERKKLQEAAETLLKETFKDKREDALALSLKNLFSLSFSSGRLAAVKQEYYTTTKLLVKKSFISKNTNEQKYTDSTGEFYKSIFP
ncbi:MAG: hypothetical protein FJZ63_02340 [Chlamydiae bacterium]|nr:hypothetical protein [Chlamydiota bacterium]